MKADYLIKDDDRIIYNAKLLSMRGDKRVPVRKKDRRFFQTLVFEKNDCHYHVKLDRYCSAFDNLSPKDKNILISLFEDKFLNKEFEIHATEKDESHVGEIFVINRMTREKIPFRDIIKDYSLALLRNQNLQVTAKLKKIEKFNQFVFEYNGIEKRVTLDLYDTSFERLNDTEKKNLKLYIQDIMTIGDEFPIKVKGLYANTWFSDITLKDRSETLNNHIQNLLDYEPTRTKPYQKINYNALISRVIDGDSVVIYKKGKRLNVRLEGIDSPEIGQEFGLEAKKYLNSIIPNKMVNVTSAGKGHYSRDLCTLRFRYKGNIINVNEMMVEAGYAYAISPVYKDSENRANLNFKGLWISIPSKKDKPSYFRAFRKKNT